MPASRLQLAVAGCAFILSPIAAAQTPQASTPQASTPQASAPQPVAVKSAPHVPTETRAQSNLPRTPFGHPSLEGVWMANFVLPLEASPNAPMLTLPEPAAKQMAAAVAKGIGDALDRQLDPEVPELMKHVEGLALVAGERRTRAVVIPEDGKIPYTPEARKESNRGQGMGGFNNPEERPNWERCVRSMGQPPVFPIGGTNPRRFVQSSPNEIVIHTEYGDEARIIPFTDAHRPAMFHSKLGDSIAKWEGNTLVIETIGLPEADRVRLFPTFIVSNEAKVVERYTRMSEDELLYQFTVIDPKVYTAPWLAEFSVYKTDQRMFEHACHEGNYSMHNILRAERVKEERAAAKP